MIGEMINQFDKTKGTVKEFNEIFTDCPLDLPEDTEVEIKELVGMVRKLIINDTTEMYHYLVKFYERN